MPVAAANRPPHRVLLTLLGGIVVLAWIALWWLEQSSYGWLFHRHGAIEHHHHHRTLASGLEGAAFLVGWLLMTIAMMLPTTTPLVTRFQRMVAQRDGAARLVGLLLMGYLSAWLAFGVLALALTTGFGLAMAQSSWLASRPWIWGAALFLMAGAFQFSTVKYACLDKCRTPVGFLVSHWHGRNAPWEALAIGWRHGLFCVGCCWALMLLMFAVGTASLVWMLVLALFMALEKNMPWGRRVGKPLGAGLLAAGVAIVLYNGLP